MQNQLKKLRLILILFSMNSLMAQDSLAVKNKTNPILFYEMYAGIGSAEYAGWNLGFTANYQFFRNDLLTARIAGFSSYRSDVAMIAPVIGIPFYTKNEHIGDFGLLYGKRWVNGGASFSVSAGISYVDYKCLVNIDDKFYFRQQHLIGIPFELNVKFFKKEKRRLRLYYGIIPVTRKKVAFGRSIGFKLSGNISQANYLSFGISYGFGCHKKY